MGLAVGEAAGQWALLGLGNSKFNLDLHYRAIIFFGASWWDVAWSCGLAGILFGLCMIGLRLNSGPLGILVAVTWLAWSGLDDWVGLPNVWLRPWGWFCYDCCMLCRSLQLASRARLLSFVPD